MAAKFGDASRNPEGVPLSAEQERALIEARAEMEAEELLGLPSGSAEKPLSVGAVNGLVNQVLEGALPETFYIGGEVSNFRVYDRGHAFFTLKEPGAELPCVMWKDALGRLKFRPKDGMAVVVRGGVKMYEPQGKVQLYVEGMVVEGAGALEVAFRALCEKLRAEGLFEVGRKRAIVKLPRRVVVVTSRTGDVWHDVVTTAYRRYPGLHTMLFPVRVQGAAAAGEIVSAIRLVNKHSEMLGGVDLILLVRGGGSLEDLWAFNEESLARAIVGSKIPVATGIGHEPDVTVADLVGDLRGATPTAVTELTIPDVRGLVAGLEATAALLTRDLRRGVSGGRNVLERVGLEMGHALRGAVRGRRGQLERLQKLVERIEPRHAIAQGWRRVEDAERRLRGAVEKRISMKGTVLGKVEHRLAMGSPVTMVRRERARVGALENHLRAVSPQAVLERGYSITRLADGKIVRGIAQAKKGEVLTTRVSDGEIVSTVGKPKQESLF